MSVEKKSYSQYTVEEMLACVDSASPAPGGGSVSAYIGAFGAALSRMYGHLSFQKKKYEAHDEAVKEVFASSFAILAELESRLLALVDEDTAAFDSFMTAMALPKSTEEEQTLRKQAMHEATLSAISTPMAMLECVHDGLVALDTMVGVGNANAISDVGVGVQCFLAAAKGAYYNVRINCGKQEAYAQQLERAEIYIQTCQTLAKKLEECILASM